MPRHTPAILLAAVLSVAGLALCVGVSPTASASDRPSTTAAARAAGSSQRCHAVAQKRLVYSVARRRGKEILTRRREKVLSTGCGSGKVQPQLANTTASSWRLSFDEEFNESRLDPARWSTCYPWGCTDSNPPPTPQFAEQESYSPSQCVVAGGTLRLEAVAAPPPSGSGAAGVTGTSAGATGASTASSDDRPDSSCLVQTDHHDTFLYGYFEARIWLPADADAWPAFWLLGKNSSWDEIDIMESYHGNDQVTENDHFGPGADKMGNAVIVPWATSGWNTYGLDWQPGKLTWYVDGAEVWQVTGRDVLSRPAFMLLDLAVDSYTAHPGLPATMKVDYVRVWKQEAPSTGTPPPVGGSTP